MEGLKEVIDDLSYSELKQLETNLRKGSDVKNQIQEKIEEIDKRSARVCATCGKQLDAFSLTNFSLMFGPEDFKKRASFCAFDCLEHFTGKLKNLHKKFNGGS
ncbi:hypothetical protein ACFLZ7_02345 [Nanoarchaeota archaeon]